MSDSEESYDSNEDVFPEQFLRGMFLLSANALAEIGPTELIPCLSFAYFLVEDLCEDESSRDVKFADGLRIAFSHYRDFIPEYDTASDTVFGMFLMSIRNAAGNAHVETFSTNGLPTNDLPTIPNPSLLTYEQTIFPPYPDYVRGESFFDSRTMEIYKLYVAYFCGTRVYDAIKSFELEDYKENETQLNAMYTGSIIGDWFFKQCFLREVREAWNDKHKKFFFWC